MRRVSVIQYIRGYSHWLYQMYVNWGPLWKWRKKKQYKSNAKRITQNCSTILKMTPYFYGKCISHICFRIFWPKYRKKPNSNFPFSNYHFYEKNGEIFVFFYLKVFEYFLPRYQFMSLVATFSPFSNLEKKT